MKKAMIKHVFFDLDNTLWDFNANSRAIIQRLYHDFNLQQKGIRDFNAFYQAYKNRNEYLWNEYRFGNKNREEVRFERFYATLHEFGFDNKTIAFEMADFYIHNTRQLKSLLPGAIEILQYLQSNYNLHVITNGFEEVQLFKIRNCGLHTYFKTITTAETADALKPDKKIFDKALQTANAAAHESVYVGDSPEADGKGALNAGMYFIWFNYENQEQTFGFENQINALSQLNKIL